MRPIAIAGIFVLLGATLITQWVIVSRLNHVERLEQETTNLNAQLDKLRGGLEGIVLADLPGTRANNSASFVGAGDVELKTLEAVEESIKKLSDAPTAQQLAASFYEVDSWLIRPDSEKQVLNVKEQLASRLRQQVKKEVTEIQQNCLNAATGDDAIKRHGDAGQLLTLYPMGNDPLVIKEAKALAEQQVDIANRIEVLRRQRYNQWACKQIEAAINGYNNGSSFWSPKQENPVLMGSLVQSLGEVDPVLLEPAVMELYNYIIELTKGSISEAEKVDLAKQLTDPKIRRKTLGDF